MRGDQHTSLVIKVQNRLGLHARPSASFVKAATEFKSDITVGNNEMTVNGKSIMGLMMLGAAHGTNLKITANGPDANKAIKSLEFLINNKFGETI